MQVQGTREARKLLVLQFGFLILIPLILLPLGATVSLSGLLGGAIAFVSSLLMFALVFRHYRAQQPEKIVASFYSAEIAKLIFGMAAFVLVVLNVQPLSFATLILVYFFIQVIPALLINYR
jgi:F0F1-type ATP synthase assembly protein I